MHKHFQTHAKPTPQPSVAPAVLPVGPKAPAKTSIAEAVSVKENPDNGVTEEAIRVRAYCKWESAGKPEGDESRFWLEAENELKSGR